MSIMLDENTIEFWKQKYEELSVQFDEFQKSSRDFEQELETELKQCEDEINELKSRNGRLQADYDSLKNKLNEVNSTTHKQISSLQEELAKNKAVRDEMQRYIRELEQKNDDLERTNRCAMFSLGEFEAKLNEALERNAILESELDEKDELAETVQRLRDEARDLKQELAVRQRKSQETHKELKAQHSMCMDTLEPPAHSPTPNVLVVSSPSNQQQANIILNNNLNELNLQQQQQQAAAAAAVAVTTATNKVVGVANGHHQNPVTPSLRVAALNLVGDALRKVTSMEARLIATRNQMKESNRDRRSATISVDSTREPGSVADEDDPQTINGTKLVKKN